MATGKPTASDDDQGFSVSILSAASGTSGRASEPAKRSSGSRPRGKRREALWWLGVVAVGLALLAAARWQQRPTNTAAAQDAAAGFTAPATPAPSAAPVDVAQAAAPASQVLTEAEGPPPAASAPAVEAPRNPFDKFADAAPAAAATPATPVATARAASPVALAARKPTAAPPSKAAPAAAPRTAAPATAPRDRDAELVAALMANADAGREIALPQPLRSAAPLTTAERNRFAAELRQCQQRNPASLAARDACRAQACQARGYAGRTKSCPAVAAAHTPAEPPATSTSGPAA